jgi:hypothetical protein
MEQSKNSKKHMKNNKIIKTEGLDEILDIYRENNL